MGKILSAEIDGLFILKFTGDVRITLGPTISTFLDNVSRCKSFRSVVIDLTETRNIDSTALGMLAKISLRTQEGFDSKPVIISTNEDITRILLSVGFEDVFVIIREAATSETDLQELPEHIMCEARLRAQVLEAHRILMALNENNCLEFRDLVEALEEERTFQVACSLAS